MAYINRAGQAEGSMRDKDKKKAHIPWHERVDEKLIRDIATQFVRDVWKEGFKITGVSIEWHDPKNFTVKADGEPIKDDEPPIH